LRTWESRSLDNRGSMLRSGNPLRKLWVRQLREVPFCKQRGVSGDYVLGVRGDMLSLVALAGGRVNTGHEWQVIGNWLHCALTAIESVNSVVDEPPDYRAPPNSNTGCMVVGGAGAPTNRITWSAVHGHAEAEIHAAAIGPVPVAEGRARPQGKAVPAATAPTPCLTVGRALRIIDR